MLTNINKKKEHCFLMSDVYIEAVCHIVVCTDSLDCTETDSSFAWPLQQPESSSSFSLGS